MSSSGIFGIRAGIALFLMTAVGCGSSRDVPDELPGAVDAGTQTRACAPPPGTTGSPQTIDEALALINALPKPTTVACYLESLDRPIRGYATRGIVSAQPAQGRRSPRIFFFSGKLTTSIVPEGPGAGLIEFAEGDAPFRSIKGELSFPVEHALGPEAPFTKVMLDEVRTSCSMCHIDEQPAGSSGSALRYSSRALRPIPTERVPLDEVRLEAERCEVSSEPERCSILHALFSHGEVLSQDFPAEMPTLFD